MALTPQNQDAFFREVDEELRRDQVAGFWIRHGRTVIVGIVLFLVALAGVMIWQRTRAQAVARDSEALTAGLDALSKRDAKGADTQLKPLERGSSGYATLAHMALASAAAARGEPGAAPMFKTVADSAAAPEPLRQAALLRYVALEFERLPPAEVIAQLKPLAVPGTPWFGTAGELTAFAQIKLGQTAEAARLLATIARTDQVPDTIRGRAVRMAAALGLDVTPPTALTAKD